VLTDYHTQLTKLALSMSCRVPQPTLPPEAEDEVGTAAATAEEAEVAEVLENLVAEAMATPVVVGDLLLVGIGSGDRGTPPLLDQVGDTPSPLALVILAGVTPTPQDLDTPHVQEGSRTITPRKPTRPSHRGTDQCSTTRNSNW